MRADGSYTDYRIVPVPSFFPKTEILAAVVGNLAARVLEFCGLRGVMCLHVEVLLEVFGNARGKGIYCLVYMRLFQGSGGGDVEGLEFLGFRSPWMRGEGTGRERGCSWLLGRNCPYMPMDVCRHIPRYAWIDGMRFYLHDNGISASWEMPGIAWFVGIITSDVMFKRYGIRSTWIIQLVHYKVQIYKPSIRYQYQ